MSDVGLISLVVDFDENVLFYYLLIPVTSLRHVSGQNHMA